MKCLPSLITIAVGRGDGKEKRRRIWKIVRIEGDRRVWWVRFATHPTREVFRGNGQEEAGLFYDPSPVRELLSKGRKVFWFFFSKKNRLLAYLMAGGRQKAKSQPWSAWVTSSM
jgi:hypothetical protein